MKYKPKRIHGELPELTHSRLKEAYFRYENDTKLMMEYAKVHQTRFSEVDGRMTEIIRQSSKSKDEISTLLEMWKSDTTDLENTSAQLWINHENFLTRKKHEDLVRNQLALTDSTWHEQLFLKYKKPQQRHQ